MQVVHPVANLSHAVIVVFIIGLSAFLLARSDGGNVAVVEKVNYTVLEFSIYDWFPPSFPRTCPRSETNTDSHIIIYCERLRKFLNKVEFKQQNFQTPHHHRQYLLHQIWGYKFTCWFNYKCPFECKCNLTATNIIITCPAGVSIAEVEYPFGDWSTFSRLPDWLSPDKTRPVTIFFWYNTGLNSITQGAFKHLRYVSDCFLILSWNNIRDIEERQFEELSELRGLFLDNNKIASLHRNAFIGLNSLLYLYLQQNEIVGLFLPNLFQVLTNLEDMYIDDNNINEIGQKDFQGLGKLVILDIGHNNIDRIDSLAFKDLNNLVFLYLDFNYITTIHSHLFQSLTKLHWLYINGNRISEINPLHFQHFTGLILLNLKRNSISELHPLQFQNFNKLKLLSLSHNTISVIHPLQFQTLSSLEILDLGHNLIHKIHPLQFHNLTIVYYLDLAHNTISEIHPLQFQQLSSLSESLSLNSNMISELHPLQFQSLSKLITLSLAFNMISVIHPLQFQNLSSLRYLFLDYNLISEIHPTRLQNELSQPSGLGLSHNSISEIYSDMLPKHSAWLLLNHNKISTIHIEAFQNLSICESLALNHNEITELHPNLFQSMHFLLFLRLNNNNLAEFTLSSTVKLNRLKVLLLSNNKLRVLSYTMLQQMLTLRFLDVSSNHISMINSKILVNNSIPQIEMIDLRQNNLYLVSPESFSEFYNVTVKVDNEATCCFIATAHCSGTIPRSQFLTCGRLLPNQIQRANMWVLGLFAILSNLGVLFYRYHTKEKENKVQLLLISNLSISDMIMGIYMIIITSADLYYKRMFPSELWRVSFACKFAGTLSMLSSEASVFFVTLISVDRFIGIKYPFSTYRFGTKTSRVLSLVLWLTAISIGIVSIILSNVNPDWYDVSEVCTGLPLSRKYVFENKPFYFHAGFQADFVHKFGTLGPWLSIHNSTDRVVASHQLGMYFGIVTFIVLNFMCFIAISICYTGIFVTSIQTAIKAGRARDNKQERKMAMKMGAIVISDLACWAPIIILSILVQSGRHVVSPRVYTWIVTFVLPINSAINPFLYTFAALIFDFINKKTKS